MCLCMQHFSRGIFILIVSNIPGDIITFLGNDIHIERQTGGRRTVGRKDGLMDVLVWYFNLHVKVHVIINNY